MLLQTNLASKLADSGLKVAIVSADSADENMQALAAHPNISLAQWNEKSSLWDDDYLYKRMYFLEDLSANPALREKFHNALFYSKSKHPWKRVRPLWYFFIYQLIKLLPGIRKRFLQRESRHLQSSEAQRILQELQPNMLVSTYPVAIMEAKLLHAARQQQIRTVQHLLSWDNITCKGRFPVLADRFVVWGPIMYEELQAFYNVPDSHIEMCGVPHFDAHIQVREASSTGQFVTALGLDAQKPYLFVAMSSPRFAPREIDLVEWLAEQINNNAFGADMQLIVRPHPQNVQDFTAKKSWLGRLDALAGQRVAIDYPELTTSNIRWSMKHSDMLRLSELLSGCTVCLNSGSTVSIDALLHNKPVILTSFDGAAKLPYWNSARRLVDYTHLKKLVAEGGVQSVGSYAELADCIQRYAQSPDHDLPQRRHALLREIFNDDGQATERVAHALKKLLPAPAM